VSSCGPVSYDSDATLSCLKASHRPFLCKLFYYSLFIPLSSPLPYTNRQRINSFLSIFF
jgi:hypothetical protein